MKSTGKSVKSPFFVDSLQFNIIRYLKGSTYLVQQDNIIHNTYIECKKTSRNN